MKEIVFNFVALFSLIVGTAPNMHAQTLHAIIACNTTDRSIGTGMVSDMKNMRNAAQIIAANLECEYDEYVFDGPQCTKANLTKCISDMDVERDDIILFFYGGHGTHAQNNSEDPWPQMCMNTNIESLFFPVASLERLISNKQPKLRVILTNCCNKEANGVSIKPLYAQSTGATNLGRYNSEAFKKLFFENKGKVMMTSSKLGQYSWCTPEGGLFTNFLLDVLEEIGTNKLSPTWENVCKATHNKTYAYNTLPAGAKQEPYYEVKVNEQKGNSGSGSVPPPPSDNKRTESLFNALQTLINPTDSKDKRLSNIFSVANRYFTPDAHVVTVGRNGTSKIMYEEVEAFLRRLALSDNIKQINVLEGNEDSKNSLITVHEVLY